MPKYQVDIAYRNVGKKIEHFKDKIQANSTEDAKDVMQERLMKDNPNCRIIYRHAIYLPEES